MSTNKSDERPVHRDRIIATKVSPELVEKVQRRARAEKRPVSAIIRSFLILWADYEVPEGFPPEMPDETRRAPKRKRKKKRK